MDGIQERWQFVQAHEDELLAYAQKLAEQGDARDRKQQRSELEKHQKRCKDLDTLIQGLYEQVVLGSLNNQRFAALTATYENEQKTVKLRIAELEQQIAREDTSTANAMKFFQLVRKYTEIQALTAPILNDLIDSIVVHAPEGVGKARTQEVVVNFRFIKNNWFANSRSL
jgi:Fe-S cluster assembly scaffold protein SufB